MTDTANSPETSAETPKRFRSEIEFPYTDLQNAVELAQTIHTRAGSSCEADELAVWMGQTATGGTFRTRLGAARIFGLIETAQGRATLTQLGRDIITGTPAPRVIAFLNAELFRVMYDQFKGNVLPPAAAIERQMQQLGVSPKQTERARQTFMKSATYAGFIDAASGRLVKPGIGGAPAVEQEGRQTPKKEEGGGAGGDLPPIDPIIAGLLKRLPNAGDVWPDDERKLWLQLLEGSFKLIYKDKPSGGALD